MQNNEQNLNTVNVNKEINKIYSHINSQNKIIDQYKVIEQCARQIDIANNFYINTYGISPVGSALLSVHNNLMNRCQKSVKNLKEYIEFEIFIKKQHRILQRLIKDEDVDDLVTQDEKILKAYKKTEEQHKFHFKL